MRMYEHPKEGDLEEIKIELTRKCALSCIHCSSNASSNNPLKLSNEPVLSLIHQAASLHVKRIALTGGEPLLWAGIEDAIKTCKLNGLSSTIYTTGICIEEDGAEKIQTLAELGLNRVIFSVYSNEKNHHEDITRTLGSFDKTISTLKKIKSLNIKREIHFVPLKANYQQLTSVVELCKSLEIPTLSILRFVPQGRGVMLKNSHEMLMHIETVELRKLVQNQHSNGVKIRLGSPYNILLMNNDDECITAQKTLSIGPDGNIYPCDAFKNIEPCEIGLRDPYNNILNNSLKACWDKSHYLNSIRRYLTTPFEEPCKNCVYLEQCKSGCLAQKVIAQESIENGNIMKRPDPLCIKDFIGG
jgi:radical SAM protein with 4Fe4S-binding SPASM domain